MGSDPIIAIDAGNTRIKFGMQAAGRWIATGSISTAASGTFRDHLGTMDAAAKAIASNVAGSRVRADLEEACRSAGVALRFIQSPSAQLGVVNGYSDPGQLGPDRWAALVAAHHLGGAGDKLVVNAGTALTIDALASDGRFLGGLIVPGPALMRRALDRGTANLRDTEGSFHDFPRGTSDAIASGAIQACVGAIERLGAAMARRGLAAGRIIMSGGAAAEIAPRLQIPHSIHDNLVLDGLALIARES